MYFDSKPSLDTAICWMLSENKIYDDSQSNNILLLDTTKAKRYIWMMEVQKNRKGTKIQPVAGPHFHLVWAFTFKPNWVPCKMEAELNSFFQCGAKCYSQQYSKQILLHTSKVKGLIIFFYHKIDFSYHILWFYVQISMSKARVYINIFNTLNIHSYIDIYLHQSLSSQRFKWKYHIR